ncbi:MAG: hypothetical protein R3B68_16540 [Phycisphaerales bacterium]
MEIELRSGPMMVTLLGASRDRIVGVHTLEILTPLLQRVRGAIESNAIMDDGTIWALYETDGRLFVGTPSGVHAAGDLGLEERALYLTRHAAAAYAGAFDGLLGATHAMRTAIESQRLRFGFPAIEVYWNWDGNPEHVEADLMMPVR